MIELKKVSKTYKSKKSNNTIALKDISIKFPEKGLVFILGKSGSGKSTLLNIIGGLDKYDNGEVIINSKSTRKFKEKDFDAFRNTYMGFVFQEFNLLENYSIEQNIKLSLELQHKKATNDEIKNVLKLVGLEDISKRKTNELSGGQKQRVAIARALIKNPEIILADEPTGNLDTQTSEQIWKILKKLSETKLVIVVSHDVESAEQYADRIIKIQDGEIISDNGNNEVIENKNFKLQNAKLPFFYSFKMAIGSLIHKKIRLLLSSILIIFSLICFGVMLSAYTSNLENEVLDLFEQYGSTDITINKYKSSINYVELMKNQMNGQLNDDEVMDKYTQIELDEDFKQTVEKNTGLIWEKEYTIDSLSGQVSMLYPNSLQSEDSYPVYYYIGSFALNLTFSESDNISIDNLIGNKPQNDDEIVIPSYIADMIIYRGCMAKDKNEDKLEPQKYMPKNYNELISSGKYINFCNIAYVKVVGIIDNSEKLSKFASLKQIKVSDWMYDDSEELNALFMEMFDELDYNESRVYVHSSFINKMKNVKNTYSATTTKLILDNTTYYSQNIAYIDKEINICNEKGIQAIKVLKNDEIVINETLLNEITNYDYEYAYENNKNKYSSKDDFLTQYLKDNRIIGKTIKSNVNNNKLGLTEDELATYKIVGVLIDENEENYTNTVYYAKEVIESLITGNVHLYSLKTKVNTINEMKQILKYYPVDNSDVLSSSIYSEKVLEAVSISYLLEFVAKYGVVFFLLFATIILMNFISASIRFRKKEIGTLRALGCRSIDIIKMFVYESLMLMIIALLIAFALIPSIINAVNGFVIKELLMEINILKFGLTQILQITGIMLVIVILANVIPVRKITKMKPIDAILNK